MANANKPIPDNMLEFHMTYMQLKKIEELARAAFALEEDESLVDDQKRTAFHNLVRRMTKNS